MQRPKIGITTSYEDGQQRLEMDYVLAVEATGGIPMIVPMLYSLEAMQEFTALLDGLVITGGPGITQGLIGTLPDDLPPVDLVRDEADRMAFDSMVGRPILGICYGMQFINAQAGGTIYADVSAQRDGSFIHSKGRGGEEHPVKFAEQSILATLFGTEPILVNTHHIQAVADVGAGLRAVGYSPDGVIEAIESEDGRMIGVQFHPERMIDLSWTLFEEFIRRCRATY